MPSTNLIGLFAETHLTDVTRNYRGEVATDDASLWFWVVLGIAIAVIGGIVYKLMDRPPTLVNTPLGLLHELCRAHRIKGGARSLLEQVAESAGLEHPATMFLSARHLDDAVAKAKSKLNFDQRQISTLGLVRRKMFS